jgi:thymidylate kinase
MNKHIGNYWSEKHKLILVEFLDTLNSLSIKHFIWRNSEGLPANNFSKDVDIMLDPLKINTAIKCLKLIYKKNNLTFFAYNKIEKGHICIGIDTNNKFAIHLDLIAGYSSKGYECFSFEQLYNETIIVKELRILNPLYNSLLLFISKIFNYKQPFLKEEYCNEIYKAHLSFPEFKILLKKLLGDKLGKKVSLDIDKKDFIKILNYSPSITYALKINVLKSKPLKSIKSALGFYFEKFNVIVLGFKKNSKVFAVIGPDGSGKSTFIDALINSLKFYYVQGESTVNFSLYHHRPNILPNLGAVGEKVGYKEQDKDFTNPHRAKPAGKISSIFRMIYYWLDYIIGFYLLVGKDVRRRRFSIFDRYSYDFLVDPARIRLNLPFWIRNKFVKFMPHPKIVFYLEASPEVIFKRKQELHLDEIYRQNKIFKNLTSSHQRFVVLDSNRPVEHSVNEATSLILDSFTIKL